MEELMLSLNYHEKKIRQTLTCDIRSSEQLLLPYLVLSAVHTVISTTGDRTNNHSMQKPKLHHWAIGSCHMYTMPN